MKKAHGIGFCGTALAGLFLVALAGCGSGAGTSPITPLGASASPSPSVPIIVPTPLPSASAPTQAGDFAFADSQQSLLVQNREFTLAADGTGSAAFALESVNGFTSPITFPYTVTVQGPLMQPSNTQQTFDSSLATVTVNPATLSALPPGSTTVTLAVKASTTLPPLTTVTVDLTAEGGGLKRYPNISPFGKNGKFVFTTTGLAFYSFNFQNRLNSIAGSKANAAGYIQSSGLTGTGTFGVTGLPSGVTATFTRPTVTLPLSAANSSTSTFELNVTANQEIAPGTYPIRVTLTLNGVTYTSDPANLTVNAVSQF